MTGGGYLVVRRLFLLFYTLLLLLVGGIVTYMHEGGLLGRVKRAEAETQPKIQAEINLNRFFHRKILPNGEVEIRTEERWRGSAVLFVTISSNGEVDVTLTHYDESNFNSQRTNLSQRAMTHGRGERYAVVVTGGETSANTANALKLLANTFVNQGTKPAKEALYLVNFPEDTAGTEPALAKSPGWHQILFDLINETDGRRYLSFQVPDSPVSLSIQLDHQRYEDIGRDLDQKDSRYRSK